MNWYLSHQADRRAVLLANRHYSRKNVDSKQFMPPGRQLVLINAEGSAVWGTSWPREDCVDRSWFRDAWMCVIFRNESGILSSQLIAEAVACTRWKYPTPVAGMVTMIDAGKTRRKRDPDRCYRKAGFIHVGFTKAGLYILQLKPEDMPEAATPNGSTLALWEVSP